MWILVWVLWKWLNQSKMPLIVHACKDYCTKTLLKHARNIFPLGVKFACVCVHWKWGLLLSASQPNIIKTGWNVGSLTITDAFILSNKNLMHGKLEYSTQAKPQTLLHTMPHINRLYKQINVSVRQPGKKTSFAIAIICPLCFAG